MLSVRPVYYLLLAIAVVLLSGCAKPRAAVVSGGERQPAVSARAADVSTPGTIAPPATKRAARFEYDDYGRVRSILPVKVPAKQPVKPAPAPVVPPGDQNVA